MAKAHRKSLRARHLEKRGRRWYAVLDVPEDAQGKLGEPWESKGQKKKRFFQSLKTESESEAERLCPLVIAGWKSVIDAARNGRATRQSLGSLSKKDLARALDLRSSIAAPGSDTEALLFTEDKYGNEQAETAKDFFTSEASDRAIELQRTDPRMAQIFYDIATGRSFPLREGFEPWLESLRGESPKTIDMKRTDIDRFIQRFPYSTDVTKKGLRVWITQMQTEQNLKPATINRMLSFCRGFWRYLHETGKLEDLEGVFTDLNVGSKAKTKAAKAEKRQHFTAKDCVRLLDAAATEKEDRPLARLIWLGMWTGCRIEELCSLKCSSVAEESFTVEDAKTAAGNRIVPIHSRLMLLVTHLVQTSSDDYLIEGLSLNKYNDRSNAIGKRFGRLKKELGFRPQYVFHSIRKTVATELENAGVPEGVSSDILGHQKNTMTYGLYSGGNGLKVMQDAIEKLAYPISDEVANKLLGVPADTGTK